VQFRYGAIYLTGDRDLSRAATRIGAATASYLLEVQPSGHITRILAENFVPNIDTAEYLKACLRDYVFSPYEGQRPLMTRISITYGSTEGASLRR
jgi:hypothetical protein